jgi:undecaprenyl diphosphate synthase
MDDLRRHDVRVRFIGMRHRVPAQLQKLMAMLEDATRECEGLNLTIAIDYGARDELTRAVQAISRRVASGELSAEAIDEAVLSQALDTRDLPDPDFIIRTSGEQRVSNFLLWQGAYAEYWFPKTVWPDFSADAFAQAIDAYRSRQRRFGQVGPVPAVAR